MHRVLPAAGFAVTAAALTACVSASPQPHSTLTGRVEIVSASSSNYQIVESLTTGRVLVYDSTGRDRQPVRSLKVEDGKFHGQLHPGIYHLTTTAATYGRNKPCTYPNAVTVQHGQNPTVIIQCATGK